MTGREEAPANRSRVESRSNEELPVVHLVAEYWPFARTGGLAEAVRGIATFQAASGTPVTVFMPLYRSVREAQGEFRTAWGPYEVPMGVRTEEARLLELEGPRTNPRVLFVAHREYFDRRGIYGDPHAGDYPDNAVRFGFFNRAILEALPEMVRAPIVLHAHDWHTALAPVYLRTAFAGESANRRMATVLSVHNAGFQGHCPREVLPALGLSDELYDPRVMEWYGRVNLLKGGLSFSDYATTVSPTHAHELRTPAGGFGLHDSFCDLGDRFVGIRNGIDLDVWNPRTDPGIAANYSRGDLSGKAACKAALQEECGLPVRPSLPLFGMTARLVAQKGIDLILEDDMLLRHRAQFVFLGSGEPGYEAALRRLADSAPDRVALDTEFRESKEHTLLAGADLLLMPSQYEPCGLTQMRAQIYGVLPVARRVGGLADTVEDQVTGFLFDEFSAEGLERGIARAIQLFRGPRETWEEHMREAMSRDFGWESSARRYLEIYRKALRVHAGAA